MSTKSQTYYEFLTRCDHPVFLRDFSLTSDIHSPLNSILNRVMALSLLRFKILLDEIRLNLYPASVTPLTIDDWEFEYFGFTKPSVDFSQRVSELLLKVNKRFKMNVQNAIDLSVAITGVAPIITRNISRRGWVLGTGLLGTSTTLGGGPLDAGLYLVNFPKPISSGLLAKLDQRLTIIEKAGSRHYVKAPIARWTLGRAALGIDTTLGA